MLQILVILCWLSLGVLLYCYAGYGMLAWLMIASRKPAVSKSPGDQLCYRLPVTIIVSAYNEGSVMQQKIDNTLSLDYPAELLNFIFITDGSDDHSISLLKKYPAIRLLHQDERKGKFAALKRAMKEVHTPIVIFSDANTVLNREAVTKLVNHFSDEKVGGVAGEKKIIINKATTAVGEAEGLYWQYESRMKKLDAGLHTVIGAAGELFSIRTHLFKEFPDDVILDDFVISMQVCLQGYRINYEPQAFAAELPSVSLAEEEKRKTRISAGAYQSIGYLKECMNFRQYPLLAFQFVSRRLLRWLFCPVMLIILFFSNLILTSLDSSSFYYVLFASQVIFYGLAAIGWLMARRGKKAWIFTVPFYFVFMNYCLARGFILFVKGRQTVLWEKSLRQAV